MIGSSVGTGELLCAFSSISVLFSIDNTVGGALISMSVTWVGGIELSLAINDRAASPICSSSPVKEIKSSSSESLILESLAFASDSFAAETR